MTSGFFQSFLDDYTQMLACPDPLLPEEYRLGLLDPAAQAQLKSHLDGCDLCRQQLANLAATAPLAEAEPGPSETSGAEPWSTARPEPAPGQIGTTRSQLRLAEHGLSGDPNQAVEAGFSRLFVIAGLGPLHLGRYREVSLCPLTELTELATEQDLLLAPDDTPLAEVLMLENWNLASALTLHLESCLGELAPVVLQQWQEMLQNQTRRPGGGKILSDGPHARFQQLERELQAYLQQPLQALAQLRQISHRHLLRVSPKGLQPPAADAPSSPLFPLRKQRQQDRILAAAAADTPSQESQVWKERLELAPDCLLDIWVEGGNLEFYAYSSEQVPLTGLEIVFPDRQGQLQTLETDQLGTAFVPLQVLATGEILLSLVYQALSRLLPIQLIL